MQGPPIRPEPQKALLCIMIPDTQYPSNEAALSTRQSLFPLVSFPPLLSSITLHAFKHHQHLTACHELSTTRELENWNYPRSGNGSSQPTIRSQEIHSHRVFLKLHMRAVQDTNYNNKCLLDKQVQLYCNVYRTRVTLRNKTSNQMMGADEIRQVNVLNE